MNKYQIEVKLEGSDETVIKQVEADTEDDACQIAFALAGGWGREAHDASRLLHVARNYCTVLQ